MKSYYSINGEDLLDNYYEINIDNQSLYESAKKFFSAQNYLSIYGSGILRIMFMKQPKKLIEIYSTKVVDRDTFFLLASEFDMNYECIPAQIISNNYNNISSENDWYVAVDELNKTLKKDSELV